LVPAIHILTVFRGKAFESYRLRMKTIRGRQSRSLWGPGEALGA
jgi:hypothetical protein